MPARHPRVHPEQAGASAPLAVHRTVGYRNVAGRPDNVTTAFAPVWLLRVSGAICWIRLILSLCL
jgi:hypothetical protein